MILLPPFIITQVKLRSLVFKNVWLFLFFLLEGLVLAVFTSGWHTEQFWAQTVAFGLNIVVQYSNPTLLKILTL